ncbi:MAG: ATP-binding cassette domain-containing protein, partial [Bdellovibrio sp.]|nr:ATP-binding cassette domain-containing protein [Bdellovibrio sp.]
MAAETQIKVQGVDKIFFGGEEGKDVIALKDINLEIPRGQFLCLLGPSGCGKSTLLNAVAGFSLPTNGQVLVENKLITEPGPDRGMVFQEYALF